MEIILLENIKQLGNLGDQVKVKAGYGRNYLIPQGKAVSANASNIAKFESRRAELERAANEKLTSAEQREENLSGLSAIAISCQASEDGKLYGSVGTRDIADAISKAGIEIKKNEVSLPNGAIRETGEYDIRIQLHTNVDATVKIAINAEAKAN